MQDWIALSANPFEIFTDWFETANKVGNFEPTHMTLATHSTSGWPEARIVLLKLYDERGFCFFTNYQSQKAQSLEAIPKAALALHWEKPEHRQIRIQGLVSRVSPQESDAYFATRPRASQLGAWASPQSQKISGRADLDEFLRKTEGRFAGQPVPRPDFWGGYRVAPLMMEFWQGETARLHRRIRFTRRDLTSPWQGTYLAP